MAKNRPVSNQIVITKPEPAPVYRSEAPDLRPRDDSGRPSAEEQATTSATIDRVDTSGRGTGNGQSGDHDTEVGGHSTQNPSSGLGDIPGTPSLADLAPGGHDFTSSMETVFGSSPSDEEVLRGLAPNGKVGPDDDRHGDGSVSSDGSGGSGDSSVGSSSGGAGSSWGLGEDRSNSYMGIDLPGDATASYGKDGLAHEREIVGSFHKDGKQTRMWSDGSTSTESYSANSYRERTDYLNGKTRDAIWNTDNLTLVVEHTVEPDGTIVQKTPGKTSVEKNGVTTVLAEDGTVTETDASGKTTTYKPSMPDPETAQGSVPEEYEAIHDAQMREIRALRPNTGSGDKDPDENAIEVPTGTGEPESVRDRLLGGDTAGPEVAPSGPPEGTFQPEAVMPGTVRPNEDSAAAGNHGTGPEADPLEGMNDRALDPTAANSDDSAGGDDASSFVPPTFEVSVIDVQDATLGDDDVDF